MANSSFNRMEPSQVQQWVQQYYGLEGTLKPLVGYDDTNFKFTTEFSEEYLVKISSGNQSREQLAAQNKILEHLQSKAEPQKFPKVQPTLSGDLIQPLEVGSTIRCLRLLSFLKGQFLHEIQPNAQILKSLGKLIGLMDKWLQEIKLPCLEGKRSPWDLQYSMDASDYLHYIKDPHFRRLAAYYLQQYQYQVVPRYRELPRSVIHGDANDHNILVSEDSVTGIIDFGDACYSYRIHELAIAMVYTMMNSRDPISTAQELAGSYNQTLPLSHTELELLYPLINTRLAVSLIMSSYSSSQDSDNQYLLQHQRPVKSLMDYMLAMNPLGFSKLIKDACHQSGPEEDSLEKMMDNRHRHISKALSISYRKHLHIVRGAMQYLYSGDGRAYLDGVNNICHVGHCHPGVVRAASRQLTVLNTNTRYLYDSLNHYAEKICSLLPVPLEVVFFVNSGSEANDLALRIARNYTGHSDMVVLDSAYHGNSSATLEISPYKYQGKGGTGGQPHIHQIPLPDPYRGQLGSDIPSYIRELENKLDEIMFKQGGPAGFIAESLAGCGGQIEYPQGFLKQVYAKVRSSGGLCIADEVQVGFGRVGSKFWGFETQEVIPDIVTMGKPMGNGHPLAAVVTTREIARSFENGMEYFNSFGGNPVSCEIGLAVLKIIEEEKLQSHAHTLGKQLKSGMVGLQKIHAVIGDVRGRGLFQGMELVQNRHSKEPAPIIAEKAVENMRARGILLSTDGPDHNVIKIKPPMVITSSDIEHLLHTFNLVLNDLTDE